MMQEKNHKSCWVTGIAGFVGSHLADALLAEGWKVGGNDSMICGDRTNVPAGVYFKGFDCCTSGVIDFKYCWGEYEFGVPDVLIHAAATAHEGLSTFSPYFITHNIFDASVRTFSEAIAAGVKRIVFMSSMSRYGDQKTPFTEDMPAKPVDCYAIAKSAAEQALINLCESHGIKWSILIPHSIIGVRQRYTDPFRNVASIMINRCLQGKPPIIYGDGEQTRCFSPIADCLPSIVKAVNGEADSEIVNIGPDGGEITINQLSDKIISLTDTSLQAIYMPDRPNEVKNAYCSSDKARKLLGYEPKQRIDDCLAQMVDDIKRRGTKPFEYKLPIEIVTERTPKTWTERLI